MKIIFLLMLLVHCGLMALSQVPEPEPVSNSTTEQQLENITENNEDLETEDDSYLQELSFCVTQST